MKSSRKIIDLRHQRMIELLQQNHGMKIEDLARELGVSMITVRRDLKSFEEKGINSFMRGGSIFLEAAPTADVRFRQLNKIRFLSQKAAIARYAASLVNEGDTIFMNSSSTALLMLKYLSGKQVTVITNDCDASAVPRDPSVELVFTGGAHYPPSNSMIGSFAMQTLNRVMADKAFLGVRAVSAEHGLTSPVVQATEINELMMNRCGGNCIVLADSSKIGKRSNFTSGNISQVSKLITVKNQENGEELGRIAAIGVEVVPVEEEEQGYAQWEVI